MSRGSSEKLLASVSIQPCCAPGREAPPQEVAQVLDVGDGLLVEIVVGCERQNLGDAHALELSAAVRKRLQQRRRLAHAGRYDDAISVPYLIYRIVCATASLLVVVLDWHMCLR